VWRRVVGSVTAMASDWHPDTTVEILAGTPPGGGQDRVARAMASVLPFACEVTNLPGRGGGNAWDALLESPGDPHRIAVSSPTLISNRLLGESRIDDRDLTPLATLCTEYVLFVVSADSDIESPVTLLEGLRAGSVTTALATAAGNINHMALGMVGRYAGADPSGLPIRVFDSAPEAVADILEGNAEVAAVSAASVVAETESGAVRVLAVSAPERLGAPFGAVPTWSELRVPCLIGTWRGVVGPPGLTESEIARWDRTLEAMTSAATWQVPVTDHRWHATFLDRAATRSFLDERRDATAEMLGDLGLLRDDEQG
jgi:putative tricarboxylic transport membrane protein